MFSRLSSVNGLPDGMPSPASRKAEAHGDGGSLPNYATGMKNFKGTIGDKIEVVLFHDYNGVTASMLPKVIEYLENKNIPHDIFLGQILAESTILFAEDEAFYEIDEQYDSEENANYTPIENDEV